MLRNPLPPASTDHSPCGHEGPQDRAIWRRRYTLGLFLVLLLPGFVSAPITLLLLGRWLRCFHQANWRRQLRTLRAGGRPIRRLRQQPSYALARIRHQGLATLCQLFMALVPSRVAVGAARGTHAGDEAILAICTTAQMVEVCLIAAVMFGFVRRVCRQQARLAARPVAGGDR